MNTFLKNKLKYFGAAVIIGTIVILSYTVIQLQQQLNEQKERIYHTQAISMGYLRFLVVCVKELESARNGSCEAKFSQAER